MTPRLQNSLQWTDFPEEFSDKVLEVFSSTYPEKAKTGDFFVEGRFYTNEVLFKVGYLSEGRLRQHNFLFSVEFDPNKKNARDLVISLMDPMGALFDDFFSGKTDELDFPINWKEITFQGETFYFMHSTENTELEAEADRLLGLGNNDLYKEAELPADAMDRADVDTELAQEIQKKIRKGEHHH